MNIRLSCTKRYITIQLLKINVLFSPQSQFVKKFLPYFNFIKLGIPWVLSRWLAGVNIRLFPAKINIWKSPFSRTMFQNWLFPSRLSQSKIKNNCICCQIWPADLKHWKRSVIRFKVTNARFVKKWKSLCLKNICCVSNICCKRHTSAKKQV